MRSLRVALAVGTGLAVVAGLAAVALLTALRPPRVLVPAVEPRIFRDVTLVEAGRPPRPGSTLRVGDGRIEAIVSGAAAASARTSHEGAAEAPDLSGLFVAPGLIDLHVHYPPAVAIGNAELWSLLLLAHGVPSGW